MWWFDAKAGVIRWLAQSNYVLSIENGNVFRNRRLVVKPWQKSRMQQWAYKKGPYANFRLIADMQLCIDSAGGKNRDNNRMIVWTCHKGQNQKFNPVSTATRKWAA